MPFFKVEEVLRLHATAENVIIDIDYDIERRIRALGVGSEKETFHFFWNYKVVGR
jgi:hypothetical protein